MARVLIMSTSFPQGGDDSAGHFVRREALLLAEAGDEVTVLAPGNSRRDGPLEILGWGQGALFRSPGVLTLLKRRRRATLALLPAAWRVARLLKGRTFDRAEAHWLLPLGWPLGLQLLRKGMIKQLSVVAHGSDVRLLTALPFPLSLHILRRLQRAGCTLRFVSEELRRELLSGGLWPGDVTRGLRYATVLPAALQIEAPSRQVARRSLHLAEEERIVLIVGRLVSEKRIAVALRASELIPDAQVIVLGDGPLRDDLEQEFPDLRFLGHLARNEALRWVAAADLLVSASRLEGAPTAIREARVLGVPVVSVPAGDLLRWAERDADLWLVSHS